MSSHSFFQCDGGGETSSGRLAMPAHLGGPQWVLLGCSAAVRRLRAQIEGIAPFFRVALIWGERGSGRRSVARVIHSLSPGAGGAFVPVHAATFAEGMARNGEPAILSPAAASLLESARGGSLCLDGIGDLSPVLQAGLVRFLRELDRGRIGSPERRDDSGRADMRVLAMSDQDLTTLSARGELREDLLAHLSAVGIAIPPLRQRLEDIPNLAEWLLQSFAELNGELPKRLADAAVARLQKLRWPDNLHGLRSVLTHAAAQAKGEWIELRHLTVLGEDEESAFRPDRLDDVAERHVLDVLARCRGNKVRAAEVLGISRSTLYRMLEARQTRMAH